MIFSSRKKKIVTGVVIFFLLLHLILLVTGTTYVYKALWYNFANIDDYKIFTNREISASSNPQPWTLSTEKKYSLSDSLAHYLDSLETKAILVLRNDSIIFEKYSDGYSESSLSNSFSMAKSYVSALVGMALKNGQIKSIDQSVGDFIPSFASGEKAKITIRHLLTMSSGLNWDEAYAAPISTTTEAYYGDNLHCLIEQLEVIETPGTIFRYKSGDTQVLAMVLEKATGKNLSENMTMLWNILGAEKKALWSVDREDGIEKAYCCLNSNARDFARLGKLYLQHGYWNGKSIIDSAYVAQSLTPCGLPDGDLAMKPNDFYGYQWWIIPGQNLFYARGILGQNILVLPEKNIVIVRLGAQRGYKIGKHYRETISLAREIRSWKQD